jgi:hypothetical protein
MMSLHAAAIDAAWILSRRLDDCCSSRHRLTGRGDAAHVHDLAHPIVARGVSARFVVMPQATAAPGDATAGAVATMPVAES